MPSPSTFELSKWYLDCVEDSGRTFIGYAGELRWRALRIHHQSVLIHDGTGRSSSRLSLRQGVLPRLANNNLEWTSADLGVQATWEPLEKPIEATVLDVPEGTVRWRCVQPRARARVTLARGEAIAGLGYAEHLSVTIPAWRLPIKELRWGRFLSEQDSLVWIDWRGPQPCRYVFLDGAPLAAQLISDHSVVAQEGESALEMDCACVLRAGSVLESALAGFARSLRLLPKRVGGITECKWRSRATLKRAGAADQTGWAIHEVVTWP